MHAASLSQLRDHLIVTDFLTAAFIPSAPSIGLTMAVGADTFEVVSRVILIIAILVLKFKRDRFTAPLGDRAVITCSALFDDYILADGFVGFAFKHIASIPAEAVLLII